MNSNPEEREPTLRELLNLPIHNWYEVGKNLGIPEYDLEKINANQDRDHERTCKRKMFGLWITRYTRKPTYRAIVVALGDSREQRAVRLLCQSQGIDEIKCRTALRDPVVEPERVLGHVRVIYVGPDKHVKDYVEDVVNETIEESMSERLRKRNEEMKKLAPYFKKHRWGEVLVKLNYQYIPVNYYAKLDLGDLSQMNEIAPVLFRGGNFHVVCFNASPSQRQRPATNDVLPPCNSRGSIITTIKSIIGQCNPFRYWRKYSKKHCYDTMIIGSYENSERQLKEVDTKVHQSIVSSKCDNSQVKYYKHRENKVVYPVNVQLQLPEERDHIKHSISTAIKTKVVQKHLPNSWNLFASIMWECQDQGIMKLKSCEDLARECCVPNDQIPLAIRCMHDHLGLFLHYSNVPKMDDIVILRSNLLVESITVFLNKVLTFSLSIEETGLIPIEMIHSAEQGQTLNDECIPLDYIIELLKHLYLLGEINKGRCYFMPILLQEGHEPTPFDESNNCIYPARVAIHFNDNLVPQVLCSALCTILSQTWILDSTHQFKNRITFVVDQNGLHKVEVIARSECIEICVWETIQQLSKKFCPRLIKTVYSALHAIQSTHHYMEGIEANFQFFCPGSHKSGYLHFAVQSLNCLQCTSEPQCILNAKYFNQTHQIWKLDDKRTFTDDFSDEMEVDNSEIDDIMQQVEKHIDEQGELHLRIVKSNFIGQPGVGKTTVCKRLVGEIENLSMSGPYKSTGIEKPVAVHLYHDTEQRSVCISNDETEWNAQNIEEQLGLLLRHVSLTPSKRSNSAPMKSPFLPRRTNFCVDSEDEQSFKTGGHSDPEYSSDESETSDTSSVASMPLKSHDKKVNASLSRKRSSFKKTLAKKHNIHKGQQSRQPDFSHIREFIRTANWKKVHEVLEKVVLDATILYIIDTGGQPEFYEILPLLLQGPSLTILFLKLTQSLNQPFSVTYRHSPESPSSVTYQSTFTPEEMLCQVLASVDSFDSEEQRSAAFIIATYKDQAQSPNDIDKLEKDVKKAIQDTKIFRRDVLRGYNRDGSVKHVYPIDNMNGDKEEITKLQVVLGDIIKKRFRKERLPTSWGLFHLLLRYNFEKKGLCSLEDSVEVAGRCGIAEDKVDRILKYFHSHFGTILYYHDIASFKDYVICDPNVIFRPVTKLVAESFAANPDVPQTAEAIRKTGEVPRDLIHKICQDDACQSKESNKLPLAMIVELLEHHHILTELKYTHYNYGYGDVSYFMPCLLSPDHSVNKITFNDIQKIDPAPLIFSFSTGYIPIGLYGTLVVKLVHGNDWVLDNIRFKNKVGFIVDAATITKVELISHFFGLAAHIHDADHSHCLKVQRTLLASIREVMLQFPHMKNVNVGLSFYCPNGPTLHLAECKALTSPKRMMCSDSSYSPQIIDLQPKHKIWFENYEEPMDTDSSAYPMSVDSNGMQNPMSVGSDGMQNPMSVGSDASSSDLTIASTPTLNNLLGILEDKSADWDTIGRVLDIPYNFRESLRRDLTRKDISRLEAVLHEWMQSSKSPVTWGAFKQALEKIGFSDCIKKVEDIHIQFDHLSM